MSDSGLMSLYKSEALSCTAIHAPQTYCEVLEVRMLFQVIRLMRPPCTATDSVTLTSSRPSGWGINAAILQRHYLSMSFCQALAH